MLVLLYTIFILGGGGSGTLDFIAEFSDRVKVVVESEEERKSALLTLKAMKKLTGAYNKDVKRTSKEISTVLESDDIAVAEPIWEKYLQERNAYDSAMLDLRFELRDQLTSDEWRLVFPET